MFFTFLLILISCQTEVDDEATVIVTEGIFNPISLKINGKKAKAIYSHGDYEKGTESIKFLYSLKNNSDYPLTNIKLKFHDILVTEFSYTINDDLEFVYPGKNGTCQTTLPAGETCTIELEFFSDQTNLFKQTITLSYDNLVSSDSHTTLFTVNSGAPANLIFTEEKTLFSFGELIGPSLLPVVERAIAEKQVKYLTIVNAGELTAHNISFSEEEECVSKTTNDCPDGQNEAYYYEENCPKKLAPGKMCDLTIHYKPLNKDPVVGEIDEDLEEIEYEGTFKTDYINGPLQNSASLTANFSSISTRIQAQFIASTKTMVFPNKITVGNRQTQTFKITNNGFRSGKLLSFDVYNGNVHHAKCFRISDVEYLDCYEPDLTQKKRAEDLSYYIKDRNACLQYQGETTEIAVGGSCIFDVIFQPSVNILENELDHNYQFKVVYDSLFQGNETIIVDDLIEIYGQSKSKAKIGIHSIEIGGSDTIVDFDDDTLNSYTHDFGRLALQSGTYYQREKIFIRLKNYGGSTAKNVVLKDGNGTIIPSITDPPFQVNLGTSVEDDESFYANTYKSDNCNDLDADGTCTITINFSPIAFSNDDNEIDDNMYDGEEDGIKHKRFYVEYDTQANYTDDNFKSDTIDYPNGEYDVKFRGVLVRVGVMATLKSMNSSLIQWNGKDYLELNDEPMVVGNEFEYTLILRNIGTGPVTYLGSYSDDGMELIFPNFNSENYELIPTVDLAGNNANYDCLDIIDFDALSTDTAADKMARSADWAPLPKEESCAITFKIKKSMKKFETLEPGYRFESILYSGLSWMSRGFEELGENEEFHIQYDPFNLPMALELFDGDISHPHVDGTEWDNYFGVSRLLRSAAEIPEDNTISNFPRIRIDQNPKPQIRPLYARPNSSATIRQRAITYNAPYPEFYDDKDWLETGDYWEWTTLSFSNPIPYSLPGLYYFSSWMINMTPAADPGLYNVNNNFPQTVDTSDRVTVASAYLHSHRSYLSPNHIDTIIDPYKDDYPFIIHFGTFSSSANTPLYITLGNTSHSESGDNAYRFWIEDSESGDGVFTNPFSDRPLFDGTGVGNGEESLSNAGGVSPQEEYILSFNPTGPGLYTHVIKIKYEDGVTVDGKKGSDNRVLEYEVLLMAEAIDDAPSIEVSVQNYSVTPQEGLAPVEAIDGAPVIQQVQEGDVYNHSENNFLIFEFVKNGNITEFSPYQKKVITLRNTSTTTPANKFYFMRKDKFENYFSSNKNLLNYGLKSWDISDCEDHFDGLAFDPVGGPNNSCEIIAEYQPNLSDSELEQYFLLGYEAAPNQFNYKTFSLRLDPIEPALLDTEYDKNSFRNADGNLVPNANTLEFGKVYITENPVVKTFNDIRVFNTTETKASFLNEYHDYLVENNLKGYSEGSRPETSFIPPAEDYESIGSYNMALFKSIKYPDGQNKFVVYGSESCFIGDDEYPDAADHFREGFNSESSDCYIAVRVTLNEDFIAMKTNFSDGSTLDGNYFSLTYFNNERLTTSETPLYFVINGSFYPDESIMDGNIYDVESSFSSESISFKFNPLSVENPGMGDIVGYRVFYSVSDSVVENTLFTQIVPNYVDIRDNLEAPEVNITGLNTATFYYVKIYPIRYYEDRTEEFPNPTFVGLAEGEYLSMSDMDAQLIVVPNGEMVFDFEEQALIKKSYETADRMTFNNAISRCAVGSATYFKNGAAKFLSLNLVTSRVWDIIMDNPSISSYDSGDTSSFPHWIDTAPINVDSVFSGIDGYQSDSVSQAFPDEEMFYLRDEGNFNAAVRRAEGGGPSPISKDYSNYITPGIPFAIPRCYIDTAN